MEFQPIDITQILVTLISTAAATWIAFQKRPPLRPEPPDPRGKGKEPSPPENGEGAKPPLNQWALAIWALVAIAAINTGFLGWRWFGPEPATDAAITYPIDLAEVNQTETVRGTVQGLPSEHVIWVAVVPLEVGRYYPHDRPADIEAHDKWSSLAYIGIPADTGKRFDILVLVANHQAQGAFTAYLADAEGRSDWAGMESLPVGAVIYDRITVTRK